MYYSGLGKDFISSFYDTDQEDIISTYQNFDYVYLLYAGVQYNNSFFNDFYTTKTSAELNFFELKDSKYELRKPSPRATFSTTNIFNLNEKLRFNVSYDIVLPYYDGSLFNYLQHQFDVSLNYKINKNLNLNFYVYDLFKIQVDHFKITVPGYVYAEKSYRDIRSIGCSLNGASAAINTRVEI